MSEKSVPYMMGHCFLKYKLARDMTYDRQQTVVIEASHSNRLIDLDSQIDEYHTGVAQFQHAIFHCHSVQRQCFAPTSLFFVEADVYSRFV